MTYTTKKRALAVLLAGLMLLVLSGATPQPVEDATEAAEKPTVTVTDVDGFLSAVGPNVTVVLGEGKYDLASAASYGKDTGNPYCRWEPASEQGYELWISGVEGFTLQGAGQEKTILLAEDRYANVLCFDGCRDLMVGELTAGHSPLPGYCSGGVLRLINDNQLMVAACSLFGCGTEGVWATNCSDVTIIGTRIYECSDCAVTVESCQRVEVLACEVDHNGWKGQEGASCLFNAYGGDGFTVSDCRVHDNVADLLLRCAGTRNASFLSSWVEYNMLTSAFALYDLSAAVDGCSFHENMVGGWYALGQERLTLAAHSLEGKALGEEDFSAMTHRDTELPETQSGADQTPVDVPAAAEIRVSTPDEFLAALGSNRTIIVEGEGFSLADAATYGGAEGACYRWEECYDGSQLVISNVSNLTIRAGIEGITTLTAVPRYANVLSFRGCDDVCLQGLVLGHSEGMGECSGGVVDLENCYGFSLDGCRLYGCGTLGLNAWSSRDIRLTACEIHDCSIGGVVLYTVLGASFRDCRIHDVPSPALDIYNCDGILWNDRAVAGEHFDVTPAGELVPVTLG